MYFSMFTVYIKVFRPKRITCQSYLNLLIEFNPLFLKLPICDSSAREDDIKINISR